MESTGPEPQFEHTRELLRSVSRSFYLSVWLLPPAMRERVSLGYLLARLTDTIADTADVDLRERKRLLVQIRGLASTPVWTAGDPEHLAAELRSGLEAHLTHEGEQELVRRSDELLELWEGQLPEPRGALDEVLDQITHGQLLDLDHFGEPGSLTFLPDAEKLIQYTDLVAGCVGRFWTRLAVEADLDFISEDVETMKKWGTNYGRGLQILNIIRDLHEDLPRGRCYLPKEELMRAGWDEGMVWNLNRAALSKVADRWLVSCQSHLEDGLRYTKSLRNWRLRWATILPATIGLATLEKLRQSEHGYLRGKVSIARLTTYGLMLRGLFTALFGRRD